MLLASNLEISLVTTISTSAEKIELIARLKNCRWALFGIMNMCHWPYTTAHRFGAQTTEQRMESSIVVRIPEEYMALIDRNLFHMCLFYFTVRLKMLLFLINGLLEFTIKLVHSTESGMNQSIYTLRKLDTD